MMSQTEIYQSALIGEERELETRLTAIERTKANIGELRAKISAAKPNGSRKPLATAATAISAPARDRHAHQRATASERPKRTMSASARRRISAAQKRRHAMARAQAKGKSAAK